MVARKKNRILACAFGSARNDIAALLRMEARRATAKTRIWLSGSPCLICFIRDIRVIRGSKAAQKIFKKTEKKSLPAVGLLR
jgi:hypothetical protein